MQQTRRNQYFRGLHFFRKTRVAGGHIAERRAAGRQVKLFVERIVFRPWMLSESGVARPARCGGGERGGGGGPGLSDIVSRWLAASSVECRR